MARVSDHEHGTDGFSFPSFPTNIDCQVKNTGGRDGDEVVFLFSAVGGDVRAAAKHPVPLRSLVDFQRVSVAKGQSVAVQFMIKPSSLELIDENGEPRLYPGVHSFIASRGHGAEIVYNTTVA